VGTSVEDGRLPLETVALQADKNRITNSPIVRSTKSPLVGDG
jgi:hypothetical protein